MPASKSTFEAQKAQVVGTVHSTASLRKALLLRAGSVDLLELRVDHFAKNPRELLTALPRLKIPLIVTVRHPAEGGVNALSLSQRRALLMEFLPFASAIDVELRTLGKVETILAMARGHRVKVIASSHHFRSTPSAPALSELIRRAANAGADICKIATHVSTPTELGRLLSLLARVPPLPLSVMGMGSFGKISRLLLGRAGSVLNYGYLDQPNASGQWEAATLKVRLAELSASEPAA